MIYIFKNLNSVTVIYDKAILSKEDKEKAIKVEFLPKKEKKEGYFERLNLDENNKPYWEYEKIEEEKSEETPKE
jgi:hypothetical protein